MAPPSDDIEARFAVFLNPIRDLTKNWEVDIAKYLEEYLVELADIQVKFDDGQTTMNFVEAAMLVQGSATVYSKKVDFLYQMVLEMIDLLSCKKGLEEAAKTREGRKNKKNQTLPFEDFICDNKGHNIDCKEDDNHSLKLLPSVPSVLIEKKNEQYSRIKVNLYLKNQEPIGCKNDFRMNRANLSGDFVLTMDAIRVLSASRTLNDSIAGFNCSRFSVFDKDENKDLFSQDNVPDLSMGDISMGFPDDNIPAFDPGIPGDKESEGSKPDAFDNLLGEKAAQEESEEFFDIGRGPCRNRANEIKLMMKNPITMSDQQHLEKPAKRPLRRGRIRKPLPCSCHKESNTSRRSRANKTANNATVSDQVDLIHKYISKDFTKFLGPKDFDFEGFNPKLTQELSIEEKIEEKMIKNSKLKGLLEDANNNAKLGEKIGLEEASEILEKNEALEHDFNRTLDCEDVFDQHDVPDLDFDHGSTDLLIPEPADVIKTQFGAIKRNELNSTSNDTLMYQTGCEYEALVQKWVTEYISKAQESINLSEISRKVNRWKKKINPILTEEEKRKEFNIHDYGTKILSFFQTDERTSDLELEFSDVVAGCSSGEVARSFLASLMLANTHNIEMTKSSSEPLSMDCVKLKFLTTTRHHENMGENISEPTFVSNHSKAQSSRHKVMQSPVKKVQSCRETVLDSSIEEIQNSRDKKVKKSRKVVKQSKRRDITPFSGSTESERESLDSTDESFNKLVKSTRGRSKKVRKKVV